MNPITARGAVVTAEDANGVTFTCDKGETLKISPLRDDVVRVQFWPGEAPALTHTWAVVYPDGSMPREGRQRDEPCALSPAPFTWIAGALFASRLRVQVDLNSLSLSWSVAGRELFADLPDRAYTYDWHSAIHWHYLRRAASDRYYGFGERSGRLEKTGRRMRNVTVDALGYNAETSDPLYKHIPLYITLDARSNTAYGIFYDNPSRGVFDMGAEIDAFWGEYRYAQFDAGHLDYYVIYGPAFADVLDKYTRLTGRPAVMPDWALGYLGSTMSYTEAPDADAKLREFVDQCIEYDIPVSGYHLSSGYSTDPEGRRRTFCWNTDKIPDPPALARYFNENGVRLAANIKPYLLRTHPQYDRLRESGGFIKSSEDADAPEIGMSWPGGRHAKAPCAFIDFSSAAGYDWWVEQAAESLLDVGITAMWNDNNEFQLPNDDAQCEAFGRGATLGTMRAVQTLLMAHASYEATRRHNPASTPFVLTRAGSAGIQRYAQTWTGDNRTSWHTLKFNIPMGLGLSLSGMPNWGHDIGGFDGPPPDPELFIRWVQCGIFLPRFTIHSWNEDGSVTTPWMFPDVLPLIRDAIKLRYRILPHLKALMLAASQTGAPINAPTVYYHADDHHTHDQSFEFMVGPDVLVAPVYEPEVRTRTVYLPRGRRWQDWHTNEVYEGGQTVTVRAPLERLPVFVAEGTRILTAD